MYSMLYLISVQAFLDTTTNSLACLVGSQFYK